jgi:hypothetical protein
MSLLTACTTVTSGGASTPGHPARPAADGPASPAGTVSGATVPAATTTGSARPPGAGCAGLTPTAYGYNVALQGATESPLVAIEFVSARQGWAVGYGHILATTDGGRAWTTQYSGPARLDQVDFTDAGHGWAVGEDTLLATSNGGQTWTPVTDPCHAIRSVHFVTPDLGYAVFGGGQTDSTMVRLDGGVPAVPGGGTTAGWPGPCRSRRLGAARGEEPLSVRLSSPSRIGLRPERRGASHPRRLGHAANQKAPVSV